MKFGKRLAALLLAVSLVFGDVPYMTGKVLAEEPGMEEV